MIRGLIDYIHDFYLMLTDSAGHRAERRVEEANRFRDGGALRHEDIEECHARFGVRREFPIGDGI